MPRRVSNIQAAMAASMAFSAIIGAITGALAAVFVVNLVRSSSLIGSVAAPDAVGTVLPSPSEEDETISLVKAVSPAVVSVVIKQVDPEDKTNLIDIGGGTGQIVTSDGYIVTNRHVVDDTTDVYSVVLNDGTELPATVVSRDPVLDIAVLKIAGSGFPTVTFGDSSTVQIGESVVAIGNTLSAFRNTVTKGVISGVNRTVVASDASTPADTIEDAIQTDAAINPGNSGGPLLDLRGEVIGMNTAVSFDGQSVGFALPSDEVLRDVQSVETSGRIIRPWLGVRYGMIDAETAQQEKLSVDHGALVNSGDSTPAVMKGSPADTAGVKDGDIIISVNGKILDDGYSLGRAIEDHAPGDVITLEIVRGEKTLTVQATLQEYPAAVASK